MPKYIWYRFYFHVLKTIVENKILKQKKKKNQNLHLIGMFCDVSTSAIISFGYDAEIFFWCSFLCTENVGWMDDHLCALDFMHKCMKIYVYVCINVHEIFMLCEWIYVCWIAGFYIFIHYTWAYVWSYIIYTKCGMHNLTTHDFPDKE